MNAKPYISPSQLGMYQRCGEQYRRRYIEDEKVPPGIAMVKGIGVHDGARVNFKQKKNSRIDLPKKDVIDCAVASFENMAGRGLLLTPDEEAVGHKKVIAMGKDSVVSLAGLYADVVAPEYQPLYVEERYRICVPDASHDLLGIMDLADEKRRVVDLKTTGKKKPESEVRTSEQLTFYALIYKALTGEMPSEVRLEVLVDKTEPERQMLVDQRDGEDLVVLMNRVNAMLGGLEAGIFIPASAGSWMCDPRWCGYFTTCKYARRK